MERIKKARDSFPGHPPILPPGKELWELRKHLTTAQIAKRYGVKQGSVQNALRKYRIKYL